MVTITIDGFDYRVPRGSTILEAARQAGFEIPTLCYHEAMEPFGSCRLCLVEVAGGIGERGTVTASCTYPVEEDGLFVHTATPVVLQARKMNLALLLARCPGVECLQELAHSWWADLTGLPVIGDFSEECILCGRCVRVCREAIGKEAISFAFRGTDRTVSAPFDRQPEDCTGCTACEFVCPTGAVKVTEEEGRRFIAPWHSESELLSCSDCGAVVATRELAAHLGEQLEQAEVPPEAVQPGLREAGEAFRVEREGRKKGQADKEKAGSENEAREEAEATDALLCPRCRRRRVAGTVTELPAGKFALSRGIHK